MEALCDYEHPLVQQTAHRLTQGVTEPREKLARVFKFVRDDVLFGFSPEGDFVKASQTIVRGEGQCNTKGFLFLALCKVVGIPARLHFSRISKKIQHGFFCGLFYWLMPNEITHSWLEVEIDGCWHQVDTYINDIALHKAAVLKLQRKGWLTGCSVSAVNGEPCASLSLSGTHYSQMGAVTGDNGTWDEPAEFLDGPDYLNRPGLIRQWLYKMYLPVVNARIKKLRQTQRQGIKV